jgi:hypothetical protein
MTMKLPEIPGPALAGRVISPQRCETCKWGRSRPSAGLQPSQRECHLNPPITQMFPANSGGTQGFMTQTFFPIVLVDWDCSHWQPRIERTN